MEKIQGMNGAKAACSTDSSQSPFANGYIDDPQEQTRRILGLLVSLNSLHKLGLVHHDIKLENYMIEKRELPQEEIEVKVEARVRQMTGITGEEKDLTEGNKQTLNEAKERARANLKPEDLYEFHIRIIDMGTLTPIGEESPSSDGKWAPPEDYNDDNKAIPADDMYRFATTLPVLLFGKAGNDLQKIFQESTDGQFAEMRKGQDEKSAKINSEIFFIGQIFPETISLIGLSLIEYIEQHRDELYTQKGREIEAKIQQLMQPMTTEDTCQFMFKQLQAINEKMKITTGQFYPEPVLMEFAEIMTFCLSEDPTQRPTAESVLRKVTHLSLSNWQHDAAGEYEQRNTYKIEGLSDW
jgi:serine/threonine protein kinase